MDKVNINDEITILKGVGPKIKAALNNCGIYNILDLILYFPRDYEYTSYCQCIDDLKENDKVTIKGKVAQIKKDVYIRKNLIISNIVFFVEDSKFEVKWFNQPYMKNKFRINEEYTLSGTYKVEGNKKNLINPVLVSNDSNHKEISPKYKLRNRLTDNFFIKIISEVLGKVQFAENLSSYIVKKYNLCSLDYAIVNIHNPESLQTLEEAKKRLKFQELFTYSLKLELLKEYKQSDGISFKISPELKELKEKLPYTLTEAQNKVIREILIDEKKSVPMNRLVQGDVGSGKTIVALIVLFNVIRNGYQGTLLAPTEILANQHYSEALKLYKEFDVKVEILTGSTSNKNKKRIKEDLKTGKIDIIIGTHALLEEDVEFINLGMIVTDEQHRFGVRQRNRLCNKNDKVDVLVMSATPIPRTLALTLYGDLDISTIDMLPPGRKKIDTFCVNENERKRVYNFALKEMEKGAQVYIVCPLVEENEDLDVVSVEELYTELKENYFHNVEIDMLHGKMQPKLKEEIMEKFKKDKIKVLISTTVIEVGVNVPNATLMIIENSERFGLSQLHQLRGRVGRGSKKSYCILISKLKNEITKKRMNIITSSNDGFFIAEEDLKLRGSGEIFGTNQHGEEELIFTNIVEDYDLFKVANYEAKVIAKSDNKEDILIKNKVKDKLHATLKYICFN
jgi:ATP-dependent DNA helicase RecG